MKETPVKGHITNVIEVRRILIDHSEIIFILIVVPRYMYLYLISLLLFLHLADNCYL